MSERINHKRLDAVQNWTGWLAYAGALEEASDDIKAEFEALRRLEKPSRAQARRISHLEKHLDAGDVACECYEKHLPTEFDRK